MKLSYLKLIISLQFSFLWLFGNAVTFLSSDTSGLNVFYKVQNEQLMIRWKPSTVYQWKKGLKKGYVLEKYLISKTDPDHLELVYKTKEPILPMEFSDWESSAFGKEEQFLLLRDLIFIDKMSDARKREHYPPELYNAQKRNKSRFLFTNFIQNGSFDYTLFAGLGFLDESMKNGEQYLYKIYLAAEDVSQATSIRVDPVNYREAPLPELQCEFGSDEVEFTWNTKDYLEGYYGYSLSKSEDGINFNPLSETPFFNLYDHLDTTDIFDDFYYKEKLTKKDVTYWFRLRGADYFGGISERFTVCSGEGYQPVNFSPTLTNAIQTDSNYAFIEWKLLDEFEPLVEEFQVFRSDKMDGIYQPVLTNIDKQERSVAVKMVELANYYRIVAVPHRGPKVSSFPVLVMGVDEIPPVAPLNFQGTIDSAGIVQLSWSPNIEEDLDGYIVFKSYVKNTDFARITSKPIKDQYFLDSVNIQSGNELVYYKLQAVDKVNNRSVFTDVLEIKKIDRFPPVEPHIHDVKNFADRIEIKWHKSGSKDVVLHRLLRKKLDVEKEWSLLDEYGLETTLSVYVDNDIEVGYAYAYTLIALDDDGLESQPAQVAIGKPVDYKLQNKIEGLEITYLEESGKVKINWEHLPVGVCDFQVFKGANEAQPSLLEIIAADMMEFKDGNVKKGQRYTYYLKASCEDGTRSPFSEKMEIVVPQ
jgi:fibronectin type 3 domain-containing protein